MAQTRLRKPAARPARSGLGWVGVGAAVVIGLGVFLPPALLLLGAGLIPAATAYITDRGLGKPLFRTVLPLNFAGVMVYVAALWRDGGGLADAIRILEAPVSWLVMYAAAGAGTLLHFAMPAAVTAILKDRLRRRRINQERMVDSMRAEWGVEVCPPEESKSQPPS